MNKRLKRTCENLGWSVWDYDNDIEFHKYSPAGEDFFFAVNKDDYLSEVIEYFSIKVSALAARSSSKMVFGVFVMTSLTFKSLIERFFNIWTTHFTMKTI